MSLSQARYSLGANRVGPAQYPASLEPTARVELLRLAAPLDAAAGPASPWAPLLAPQLALSRLSLSHPTPATSSSSALRPSSAARGGGGAAEADPTLGERGRGGGAGVVPGEGGDGLRRRVGKASDGERAKPSGTVTGPGSSPLSAPCPTAAQAAPGGKRLAFDPSAPLSWFGVVVPPTLRQAQGQFGAGAF